MRTSPAGGVRPSLPVVIGAGSHPFPFRTRKLSLLPPMVLHGKLCGRVGRCRHYLNARELWFAGVRLYASFDAHSFPCAAWAIFLGPPRTLGGGVGELGRCRHYLNARELWFAGVRLYAGKVLTHTVSHALHGLYFLGRLA